MLLYQLSVILQLAVPLTLKALGSGVCFPPPVRFWLITSEVESFSTRNFVTFPNNKCRIRKKYFFRNLLLRSRDMAILEERASLSSIPFE